MRISETSRGRRPRCGPGCARCSGRTAPFKDSKIHRTGWRLGKSSCFSPIPSSSTALWIPRWAQACTLSTFVWYQHTAQNVHQCDDGARTGAHINSVHIKHEQHKWPNPFLLANWNLLSDNVHGCYWPASNLQNCGLSCTWFSNTVLWD